MSTGLRRKELVRPDIEQVEPNTPDGLRRGRNAKIRRVQGKARTGRTVLLIGRCAAGVG